MLKRVAVLIPAQTVWGTRVEEPQVEHGVEVRVRECGRHVSVSKVSHSTHETHNAIRPSRKWKGEDLTEERSQESMLRKRAEDSVACSTGGAGRSWSKGSVE